MVRRMVAAVTLLTVRSDRRGVFGADRYLGSSAGPTKSPRNAANPGSTLDPVKIWRHPAVRRLQAWGDRLWRLGVYSVAAWGLALAGALATSVLLPLGMILLPVGIGAMALSGWRWAIHGVGSGQRRLARDLIGSDTPPLGPVDLGPLDPRRGRGAVRRRRRLLASSRLWRESGYQFLAIFVLLIAAMMVVVSVIGPVGFLGMTVSILIGKGAPKSRAIGTVVGFMGLTAFSIPMAYGAEVTMRRFVEWGLGPTARHRLEERIADLERTRHIAVAAAEDERRRVERDLHDGAQAGMVAVAVQLGLAAEAVRCRMAGPEEAVVMIDDARRLALDSVEHLRALARGLHPGVLSARGLAAALAGLAVEAPIVVTVRCEDDLGLMSPEAEAAAYFCTAEALANVYKHAGATEALVELTQQTGVLVLSVTDDGEGGATIIPGGGLQGLVDRLSALDGKLELGPGNRRQDFPGRPRQGTRVIVTLPLNPASLTETRS